MRDGGMTLALETIKSVPLPTFEVNPELVSALVNSETTNKVFKMNAGALQENIKHDLSLIEKLNDYIAPQFSARLILTHANSELVQIGDSVTTQRVNYEA